MSEPENRPDAGATHVPATPHGGAAGYPPPGYPPAAGIPPPGYPPAAGYPPPGYGYPGPRNSSSAIAVMSLGISGIVLTTFCPGLGVVTAIIALVMAGGAQREIEESGGQLAGLGMITAGRITSWVTIGLTVLVVLAFLLYIFWIGAAVTAGASSQ